VQNNISKKKIDLVILAGGKGSRIKKYLKDKPKPLIKINNVKFLDYLLNNVCKYNINKIYILAGFRGEEIYKKYHNKVINLVPIECIIEKTPLGTGGSLNSIKNKISEKFILINGDTIFDVDLNMLMNIKLKKNNTFMALTKNTNYKKNKTLLNLKVKNQYVCQTNKTNFINGGIYILNKSLIKNIKKKFLSFENDILLNEIKNKRVVGKSYKRFFIDIGTPKNLDLAKKIIPKYFKKPAVFLDRDGTINYDYGYVHKLRNFKIIPKTLSKLKKLSKKYFLFIVTNQAGIAKGKFSEKDFLYLHRKLKIFFLKNDIYFNDVKYCPYHPRASVKRYKKNSLLRKPGNLMIKEIFKRWDINKKQSFMVGDKKLDYMCAKKSNLKFFYIKNNLEDTLKNV